MEPLRRSDSLHGKVMEVEGRTLHVTRKRSSTGGQVSSEALQMHANAAAQLQMATDAIVKLAKMQKDPTLSEYGKQQSPTAPKIKLTTPSVCKSLLQLFTFRFFKDFCDTGKELETVYNQCSLVAALMLTVVSLSSADLIGDKLDDALGAEVVRTVYTIIAFFSIGMFFFSMLLSVWLSMMLALITDESNGEEVVVKYLRKVSFISRSPLLLLIAGNYLWMALQFWILFSNVNVWICAGVSGGAVLMLAFMAGSMSMTIRALYSVTAD